MQNYENRMLTEQNAPCAVPGESLSSLSKKTLSSKVGDELRTNLLNVHMTIT